MKAGDYIDQALAAAQAATPDRRDGDLRVLRIHDWTAIAGSPIASVDTMHNYMRTDVVGFALHHLAELLVQFAPSTGGDTVATERVILVRRREPVGTWKIHSYNFHGLCRCVTCKPAPVEAGERYAVLTKSGWFVRLGGIGNEGRFVGSREEAERNAPGFGPVVRVMEDGAHEAAIKEAREQGRVEVILCGGKGERSGGAPAKGGDDDFGPDPTKSDDDIPF